MKKQAILPLCLGCVFTVLTTHAIDLKNSKLTQVVNDVEIISAANQQEKAASVNDVFSMPDILRTGIASRAELVAEDETVTRVGANTIFSFDPASRTINLKQGSLLFHSPHGKGGGTIHTGSATASVLGTTLIVTTTPSGGMKVLDLEGSVEVKFLNGLKQNLAPGHMTFVMPGGNQLSPIIIFRLDNLTKNSLLVGGFHQNLASMPLIQQQINNQLKLIQNGKLTDTGTEVAGEPNGKKISVIDLNTLQADLDASFGNSARVTASLSHDAIINQPLLPADRVFLDEIFILPHNKFYTGQPFVGLAAKNIFVNTLGLQPLRLDLSPYAAVPEFDMVAAGNLTLAGSVDFDGLASSESIIFSLVAGKQIFVTPGVTINADIPNFEWQAAGTLTLNDVNLNNGVGNTAFGLGGDFVMENGANVRTYGNLTVRTTGNIAVNQSTLAADSIIMNSAHGTIGFDSSATTVNTAGTFTSAKDLTVKNSTFNANGLGLNFTSGSGLASITGTSFFGSYSTINVTANTINLKDVAFGSGPVSLKTSVGRWYNTAGGSGRNGYVNNYGGNTWNGQALNAANEFSGTIAGTSVTISKR